MEPRLFCYHCSEEFPISTGFTALAHVCLETGEITYVDTDYLCCINCGEFVDVLAGGASVGVTNVGGRRLIKVTELDENGPTERDLQVTMEGYSPEGKEIRKALAQAQGIATYEPLCNWCSGSGYVLDSVEQKIRFCEHCPEGAGQKKRAQEYAQEEQGK